MNRHINPLTKQRRVRVVIVEDYILLRELIVKLLSEKLSPVHFVATVATLSAAIRACLRFSPDLLLVRVAMLNRDNESAVARLRQKLPKLKILLYAGPAATDQNIIRAIRHGVSGCIGKRGSAGDFLAAIEQTRTGGTYFCSESSRLLSEIACGEGVLIENQAGLSRREVEIMQLIADGHTSKQIARLLGLSVATVDTHRRNLNSKTGAHNAADLIRYGHRCDLLLATA